MSNFFAPGGYAGNIMFARSKFIVAPLAVGTYELIRIPKNAFLMDVWLQTLTACTAGTALAATLGFKGNGETADTDYFMTNNDSTIGQIGMARASQAAVPFEGKWFQDASGAITLTLDTGSNLTAGKLVAIAQYTVLH